MRLEGGMQMEHTAMAAPTDPLLSAGSPAPSFLLRRSPHAAFGLRDAAGAPLVLAFYPGVWEPVTASQLRLYQDHLPEFQRLGALLAGVSIDHIWCQLAFGRLHRIGFPLLSDFHPRGAVAAAYGVYRQGAEVSRRALFVIDGAGTIRWSRSYPDSLNSGIDGVLSALEQLQQESGTRALHATASAYDKRVDACGTPLVREAGWSHRDGP